MDRTQLLWIENAELRKRRQQRQACHWELGLFLCFTLREACLRLFLVISLPSACSCHPAVVEGALGLREQDRVLMFVAVAALKPFSQFP